MPWSQPLQSSQAVILSRALELFTICEFSHCNLHLAVAWFRRWTVQISLASDSEGSESKGQFCTTTFQVSHIIVTQDTSGSVTSVTQVMSHNRLPGPFHNHHFALISVSKANHKTAMTNKGHQKVVISYGLLRPKREMSPLGLNHNSVAEQLWSSCISISHISTGSLSS